MASSVFRQLAVAIWGELTPVELRQTLFLSLVFFLLVECYWVLRIVKDTMFETMVGLESLPTAKVLSMFVNVPLVIGYGRLVDAVTKRHYILYLLFLGYGFVFGLIAFSASFLDITTQSPEGRVVGWVTFYAVETFGSISIAGFWAYVSDSIEISSSTKVFPFVNMSGQFGSIFGPLIAGFCIHEFEYQNGVIVSFGTCGLSLCMAVLAIKYFSRTVSPAQHAIQREPAALFDGLKLVCSNPYVLGILGISTIYHTIATISDFQMKRLAKVEIPDPVLRTEYMASFGFVTNVTSFAISVFGTGFFLRRLGLTVTLLTYPIIVLACLIMCVIEPTLSLLFAMQVILKAVSYALNNPAKEALYVATTPDVKYQAKSWIDMFGSRVAKAVGAGITQLDFLADLDALLVGGSLFSIGFTILWLYAGYYTGQKHKELVASKTATEAVQEKEKKRTE